jgi:hypothetical protein
LKWLVEIDAAHFGLTDLRGPGQVHADTGTPVSEYGVRRAAYDIKKLPRQRYGPKDRKVTQIRTFSGWPALPDRSTREALRVSMRNLFTDLGIAA